MEVINKRLYDFTKQVDILQTILLFVIGFTVPTFLGQLLSKIFGNTSVIATNSQLIIGTIINCILIICAINIKGKKIFGIITMPSISTIASGYIFKTASPLMAYMIPAIWLGNFALVYFYKLIFVSKNKNFFLAGIIGIIVKVLVIFTSFKILNCFGVFPEKLVLNLQKSMGIIQLITATLGLIFAFGIFNIQNTLVKINNIKVNDNE